jgi:succinate dehydrogenase/fumarate reductase flavoprotein subunit
VGYGGGLRINTECETDIKGLYAAGDATCGPASGVEGFCAYAIPFACTSGARSGIAAWAYAEDVEDCLPDEEEIRAYREELSRPLNIPVGVEPDHVVLKVQELIFPMDVYLLRHGERLQSALDRVCELRDHLVPALKAYDPHYLRMAVEAAHMVTCAEMFLRSAMLRTESRGSHLREDFPEIDNINWLKWIILTREKGAMKASTEAIPIHAYPMRPEKKQYLHPIAEFIRESKTFGH